MLQTPIDHIDQTSRKHVLVRSGTQEFAARRVIVAMTPRTRTASVTPRR